jgi:hypothetical protein
LDRTDSIDLKQDGCLAKRKRKDESQPKGNESWQKHLKEEIKASKKK